MRAEQVLGAKRARELAQRAGIKIQRAKREDGYASKLEARYAQHLELLLRAGELSWWAYEPLSLQIAKGARYRPDFIVIEASGAISARETKGFMREAAQVRLRVAARAFPWLRFVLVRSEGGAWVEEEIRP